jgi:hypothetical protein
MRMLGFCTHPAYTWPRRAKPGERCLGATGVTGIYVVCLDCGEELAFSWNEMKVSKLRVKLRAFPAYLWRRWPITTVAIALAIGIWAYDDISASSAADSATLMPSATVPYAPPIPFEPLVGSHHSSTTRRAAGRARDSKAALSAFKRIRVGQNEVDYVAEGVTIRLFTPRPTPTRAADLNRQLNSGVDVAVRYFANKPALVPQTRPDSVATQSLERSLPISK